MAEAANVTSIEAIKEFRASYAIFCEEAKGALTAIDMESRRVLDWLLHEQQEYWKRAIRDRQDDLAQAKADLYRRQLARLTGEKPDVIEQKEAVALAQRRLEDAEERLENCRRWSRQLLRVYEDYKSQGNQLAAMVEGDPAPAVLHLGEVVDRLESYVLVAPPTVTPLQPAPTTSAAMPTEDAAPTPPKKAEGERPKAEKEETDKKG